MLPTDQSQPYSQIIKLAQYLTSLTVQQDVWLEVGKALKNFFSVDLCVFGEQNTENQIILRDGLNPGSDPFESLLANETKGPTKEEIRELVADSLESGFLNTYLYLAPETLSTIFLPIILENRAIAVMIVGHRQPEPLPKELLDVYLAVAGLVGTTYSRLASERELRGNRESLSVLVNKRTAELTRTNQLLKHEIGERKHMEQELLLSEMELKEAQSIAHIGSWKWDVNSGDVTWSDEMFRIFGIDKNSYTGQLGDAAQKAMHPDDLYIVMPENAANIANVPFEYRIIRPDGAIRLIWAKAANTIFDQEGKPTFLFGVAQDITDRKQAESALLVAQAELEKRVLERTTELRKSNQALEIAMRARDEFMAAMSHELRTPLTGVLGLSQVLQMPNYGNLSDKQRIAVENIEKSGQRLLNLINDVLDYSNLQSGNLSLDLQHCTLNSFCQDELQAINRTAVQKNQISRLSIHPNHIDLTTDQRRLHQVLSGLLQNASKFTNNGGEFGIEVQGDQDRGVITISVWDTGIGIDENDFPHLFQPFKQLDASIARRFEGTGLGLTLVKLNAELLGGSVSVTSQVRQGSRFTVILPWN